MPYLKEHSDKIQSDLISKALNPDGLKTSGSLFTHYTNDHP